MFNKKIGLLLISFVLIIGLVTALEVKKTEFVIKTDPYQNISIIVINPDETDEEEREVGLFGGRARKFGEYRFTYYGTIKKVTLLISIINNETEEVLKESKFGPYNLGANVSPIDFYLGADSAKSEDEETTDNLNTTVQTGEGKSSEEKSLIQGFAIRDNLNFSSKYYYVGAAVLAVLILTFIFKRRLTVGIKQAPVEPHPSQVIKSKPSVPSKKEVSVSADMQSKTSESGIGDTEKKIEDLQKQLEQIRSEEKILKLQKQIDQEKQSLKRMQEGPGQLQPSNQNNQETKPF